jgi:AcrR family transcriptional regulator
MRDPTIVRLSGMPERQQRAVVTRAAIIEGAARVFDQRGYAGTTIDAIAESAGVTKGALYFHFTSKADVAQAVIETQHRISREYGERAFARGSDAMESMMWMSQGLAQQMISEVVVSAGIRLSTESGSTEVPRQDPYTDWMATCAHVMGLAMEQGDIDSSWDPALIGRMLIPAYTGVQLVSDVLNDRADLFDRLRELWLVLLAAFGTDQSRARTDELVAIIAPDPAG